MQTRLPNLQNLLNNFVGVGVLLGFLMTMVYYLLKVKVQIARHKPFGEALLPDYGGNVQDAELEKLREKR
jgi:hypothetical protein